MLFKIISYFSGLLTSQREVAMISEMIHTASLVHDDVIDQSDFRRGKPSVNVRWNHKKVRMNMKFLNEMYAFGNVSSIYYFSKRFSSLLLNVFDIMYAFYCILKIKQDCGR